MADMNITQDKKSIPTGFKLTEIGVIPEDWTYGSLERICPTGKKYGIVDGPFGSNLKTEHYKKSGIPIISSGFVTTGQFLADEYIFVDKEKFRQEKRSAVAPGDIVMAKIGARCGASAIFPIKHEIGILSGNALKITVNENKHETYFIWQFLWDLYSKGKFDEITAVGAQPAISMPHLKKLLIPLPTKSEQTAIANVLSDTDALITELEQLITKKGAIKTATMQQLLTGRTRLPQFAKHPDGTLKGHRSSELGSITEDWQVVPFKDVLTIKHGKNQKEVESPSGQYPIYATGGQIGNATSFLFDKPSVLIGRKGTIDKPKYADTPFWTVDTLFYSEIKKNVCVKFIYYKFCMIDWMQYNEASGVPSLNAHTIENVLVVLPNMEEQTAIATILSDMDAELEALEQKLSKARDIKQGMMQQLLTGRIRLPLDQQS
ncbi:restriction endonuclease subunit S [Yersinia intermedia]|uniref:restriction endonuclease subunit S n=1 Tax=Yersinia intermedia TaxID=631 RepID=UPI00067D83F6|nr:restriction endonuclease subunit S [Yersinia intermedia]